MTGSSGAVRPLASQEVPSSGRENIRSIVLEELARLQGAEGRITFRELEERLRLMAETLRALQERMDELGARSPIAETDLWREISSLEVGASLTRDEKAILVRVLRQNIALQKSERVNAAVERHTAE